ncbi:hypothetical protein MPL1032_10192 [Mesorhizobium plurifarium]|uniref:Uncharacterized protein n=1 Tax=Mesorhizobium plurifarium TaxID=69974 RepID=A0A0K2VNB6_MESPL|nr:hypothetical protein MPL1032_10192 [Mesorhizobium plurifarium]
MMAAGPRSWTIVPFPSPAPPFYRCHGLIAASPVLRQSFPLEDKHGRHFPKISHAAALAGDVDFAARLAAAPGLLGGCHLDRPDQRAVCNYG